MLSVWSTGFMDKTHNVTYFNVFFEIFLSHIYNHITKCNKAHITKNVSKLYFANRTKSPMPCSVTHVLKINLELTHLTAKMLGWWFITLSGNSNVSTWAWSFRTLTIALQMVGWLCPTSLENSLFHPSHILFILEPPSRVMVFTFHINGG